MVLPNSPRLQRILHPLSDMPLSIIIHHCNASKHLEPKLTYVGTGYPGNERVEMECLSLSRLINVAIDSTSLDCRFSLDQSSAANSELLILVHNIIVGFATRYNQPQIHKGNIQCHRILVLCHVRASGIELM